jgi:hypothetical protein
MRKILLFILSFPCFVSCFGDSLYVRRITDTLSSEAFFGRGYTKGGLKKASQFLQAEMRSIGLQVQLQEFTYPVNTFPGNTFLEINGKRLRPGRDFIASSYSGACKSSGTLQRVDDSTFGNNRNKILFQNMEKLTWTANTGNAFYSYITLLNFKDTPAFYKCDIDAVMIDNYKANNIIGRIRGSVKPDSVVMFTAHYDHLGGFGDSVYFAGANDNAAGVGLMLSLAKWYHDHPPPFTVVFIAFAGEEVGGGLMGSKYFIEHPAIKLKNISFLINLDMVGNGEEGITVVNATEFPSAFSLLQKINYSKHYISHIYSRGKARNSDHYLFTENGVPSFFIYTMGKRKAYHDVDDVSSTLALPEVNDLELLITQFVDLWMNGQHAY